MLSLVQEAEGALQAAQEQLRVYEDQVADARAQMLGLEANLATMETEAAKVRMVASNFCLPPWNPCGLSCSIFHELQLWSLRSPGSCFYELRRESLSPCRSSFTCLVYNSS